MRASSSSVASSTGRPRRVRRPSSRAASAPRSSTLEATARSSRRDARTRSPRQRGCGSTSARTRASRWPCARSCALDPLGPGLERVARRAAVAHERAHLREQRARGARHRAPAGVRRGPGLHVEDEAHRRVRRVVGLAQLHARPPAPGARRAAGASSRAPPRPCPCGRSPPAAAAAEPRARPRRRPGPRHEPAPTCTRGPARTRNTASAPPGTRTASGSTSASRCPRATSASATSRAARSSRAGHSASPGRSRVIRRMRPDDRTASPATSTERSSGAARGRNTTSTPPLPPRSRSTATSSKRPVAKDQLDRPAHGLPVERLLRWGRRTRRARRAGSSVSIRTACTISEDAGAVATAAAGGASGGAGGL